ASTEQPIYITSTNKKTFIPVSTNRISDAIISGSTESVAFFRSSRYKVISRTPIGRVKFSISLIFSCKRLAKGTPLVFIPTKTRAYLPLYFSRISWAIRVSARLIAGLSCTSVFFFIYFYHSNKKASFLHEEKKRLDIRIFYTYLSASLISLTGLF